MKNLMSSLFTAFGLNGQLLLSLNSEILLPDKAPVQLTRPQLKDLDIIEKSRNSYSKTDKGATFIRMKEGHMRNGQLKPAYSLRIAVNSEYLTCLGIFSNRTDFDTLAPFLQKMKKYGCQYEEVCADTGYESLDNYLYLEQNGQISFITTSNYEQKKTKNFRKQLKYAVQSGG